MTKAFLILTDIPGGMDVEGRVEGDYDPRSPAHRTLVLCDRYITRLTRDKDFAAEEIRREHEALEAALKPSVMAAAVKSTVQ